MDEATQMIRRELAQTEWVEDALQIPIASVEDKNEQDILLKCIRREELTDIEIDILEEVIGRYQHALRKYEPTETLENIERNEQLVQDEKSILSLMRKSREEQIITMSYPLTKDNVLDLKLIVKNEIDAEALDDLQQNIDLFADLSQDELETYQRYAHDEQMTREERVIAEQIEQKIREKGQSNIPQMRQVAIKFLAKQTRLYGDPHSTEQGMIDIYEEMKLGYLLALFEKVQGMVGISDIDTENLFR